MPSRATAQSKHWPLTARATAGLGWKLLAARTAGAKTLAPHAFHSAFHRGS